MDFQSSLAWLLVASTASVSAVNSTDVVTPTNVKSAGIATPTNVTSIVTNATVTTITSVAKFMSPGNTIMLADPFTLIATDARDTMYFSKLNDYDAPLLAATGPVQSAFGAEEAVPSLKLEWDAIQSQHPCNIHAPLPTGSAVNLKSLYSSRSSCLAAIPSTFAMRSIFEAAQYEYAKIYESVYSTTFLPASPTMVVLDSSSVTVLVSSSTMVMSNGSTMIMVHSSTSIMVGSSTVTTQSTSTAGAAIMTAAQIGAAGIALGAVGALALL